MFRSIYNAHYKYQDSHLPGDTLTKLREDIETEDLDDIDLNATAIPADLQHYIDGNGNIIDAALNNATIKDIYKLFYSGLITRQRILHKYQSFFSLQLLGLSKLLNFDVIYIVHL